MPARADGKGLGSTEAARGSLSDWIVLKDGKIENYQVVTPTAWNVGPRDNTGATGPMERSFIGATIADVSDPVEMGHVARSFDSCLVCTVHAYDEKSGKELSKFRIGAFWKGTSVDVPIQTVCRRIATYPTRARAELAASLMVRAADRNLPHPPLGF